MAKGKPATTGAAAATPPATAPATGAVETTSNADMMRAALTELGGSASTADVLDFVKKKYGKELNKNSANSALSTLRKEFGGGGSTGGTRKSSSKPAGAVYAGIEDDLARLKELAEQYGADELLKLAEELPALTSKFGSSFKPMIEMFAAK